MHAYRSCRAQRLSREPRLTFRRKGLAVIPAEIPLGTPRVLHHWGSPVTIFEWPIRGGFACRIEIEPREVDSIVRQAVFRAPAGKQLPPGGIPSSALHEFPLGRAVDESLRLVRDLLDRVGEAPMEPAREPFPYEIGPSERELLSTEASRQLGCAVVVESVLASGDAMITRVSDGARGLLVQSWTIATLERLGEPKTDKVTAAPSWPRSLPGAVFRLAGFESRNAWPVIRPRGGAVPEILYAAVASLYAEPGTTRHGLASQFSYSIGTIKTWIAGARTRGYLSPAPARELTPLGAKEVKADGRRPEAIVTAWASGDSDDH
jgi:hypothetical protein